MSSLLCHLPDFHFISVFLIHQSLPYFLPVILYSTRPVCRRDLMSKQMAPMLKPRKNRITVHAPGELKYGSYMQDILQSCPSAAASRLALSIVAQRHLKHERATVSP